MYDVYTVLLYGCGLTPVFEHGSSDAAGDRVLRLVVGTLAVADRLSPDVHPKHPKIVIVVREGREQTVKVARELSRCIVAATARRKRAGALEYTFKELPSNLEREVSCCPSWTAESEESAAAAAGAHYALPEKFIGETGISAFAQLTTLWPSVSKRSDVKHPACSQDPRWIGVMVCLAEWEGRKQISDTVALGALEALLRSSVNRRRAENEGDENGRSVQPRVQSQGSGSGGPTAAEFCRCVRGAQTIVHDAQRTV
ncbi:hypothetical protein D5F01_LYC24255 [Larimichthys crocea]|uniref:Uncharacterized protein n=1 Tax=Larimichthys crocea TaxID=215358 RepID=A0A6G0HFB1_LARCR|nr:hypothetical protein D5F01_LYC24255 [Larimichthys crocea]